MATDIPGCLHTVLSMETAVDVWDAPPSILVLYQLGDEVAADRLVLSEDFWNMADPVTLVFVMARALGNEGHPPLPVQLPEGATALGVALFSESWALDMNGMTEKQRQRAQALTQKHGVKAHPARKELKMISALDGQGIRYYAGWMRGEDAPTLYRSDVDVTQLEGRGFDALQEMVPLVLQELNR
jgi:hypothetical protein